MARAGWSSSNFLRASAAPVTAVPLSIAFWAKSTVSPSTAQYGVGLYSSGSALNRNCFAVRLGSGSVGALVANGSGGDEAVATVAPSTTDWFHACAVFSANNARAAYLNGGSKGTNTASNTPTAAGINRTSVGAGDGSSAGSAWANGGTGPIAEVAIWNVALTDAEVAVLAKGAHPFMVRPAAIVFYAPLLGRYAPEINLRSNLATLAVQGTVSQAAHPRIIMPKRRLLAA